MSPGYLPSSSNVHRRGIIDRPMNRLRVFFFAVLLFLQLIHGDPHRKPIYELPYPCRHPYVNFEFCNISLPLNRRSQSLLSLLTLDEKIRLLCSNATGISRLGIPPYLWWSESLHGIADNGPGVSFQGSIRSATNFPQVLLAAAAFNRSLWRAVASAIGVEALAMHGVGQAGLTYFAPNINIFRDPRWGRGQETPGEDPFVVSAYAVEYVKGFQWPDGVVSKRRALGNGDFHGGDRRLILSACCKHLTAYDLEKWGQFTRYNFNAVITPQDMADTYQVPFRSCIEKGEASCVMCSYNSVNGVPACANLRLLQQARTDWNLRGYIASDCDAVATIYENQNFTKTPEDAVAAALKAGTDINCGSYMLRHMKSAYEQGKVSEEDIDRAVLNLLSVQFRLGIFDGASSRDEFGPEDVCSSDHLKLALEATKQGIVLLKNDDNLLPLNSYGVDSLALIGPLANSTNIGGDYTGIPCHQKTILDGLRHVVDEVYYVSGCQDVRCNSTGGFTEAVSTSQRGEYVIVVAGLDLSEETEDKDRYSLLLPGYQTELINEIAALSKKPLILVIVSGGPVDVSFAVDDPRIGSILWIGYPGESGGEALSEIIFGRYNPGGRLPMTWYPESFTRVPMNDMSLRADPSRDYPGRTHRFYTGDVVFEFGHGVSYTNFTHKFVSAPRELSFRRLSPSAKNHIKVDDVPSAFCTSSRFRVDVSVRNEGDMDGSHVVFLFWKVPEGSDAKGVPRRQVIGFQRVDVPARRMVTAEFDVDPCRDLSFADENGEIVILLPDHYILQSGNIQHLLYITI